jgi:hypothetical protein
LKTIWKEHHKTALLTVKTTSIIRGKMQTRGLQTEVHVLTRQNMANGMAYALFQKKSGVVYQTKPANLVVCQLLPPFASNRPPTCPNDIHKPYFTSSYAFYRLFRLVDWGTTDERGRL